MLLTWIIVFSLLGGVLSVIAASVFLLFPDRTREALLPHFVSFAIGALLGAAFLGLIPHALTSEVGIEIHNLGLTLLLGILGFFLMEKLVLWRHCHHDHCEVHAPEGNINSEVDLHTHAHASHEENKAKAVGSLVIIGDAIHNLVDGVLIAAAFMTDLHLGIVTSLAVAAHEIPQEVGDFAILLNNGFSRKRAFIFNLLASLTTVIGALIAYFSLGVATQAIPYILAIAASSFIYIAVADLIPGLHHKTEVQETIKQITLILTGVFVVYSAHSFLH